MSRKRFISAAFAIVCSFYLVSAPHAASGSQKVLAIGGAGSGGGYYILGGAIGNALSKAGIQSAVQTTGGGRQNAILTDTGEIDLGLTNNIEAYEEWDKRNRRNIRSIAPMFNGLHHFMVRADQPINGLADLNGKNYALTARGSTHDIAGRQIFEILGIKPAKIINGDRSDCGNMVRDGLIVGYFMTSGYPISSLTELETAVDLKFLGFTDRERKLIKEKAPWLSEGTIPAGTYKGLKKDLKTFASWNIMIANKNLDDETVYKILDVIYKNYRDIKSTYRAVEIDAKDIVDMVIPLHAGAVKYYREKGIKIPDKLIPPEMKK